MGKGMNTEINLIQDIKRIIKPYCFKGASKGVNVWIYYQPPIDEVFIGDAENLNQIIVNLMETAIENTEKGYIILEVKQINSLNSKTELQFSVRHTGICTLSEARNSQVKYKIDEGSESAFYFNAELERKLAVNN